MRHRDSRSRFSIRQQKNDTVDTSSDSDTEPGFIEFLRGHPRLGGAVIAAAVGLLAAQVGVLLFVLRGMLADTFLFGWGFAVAVFGFAAWFADGPAGRYLGLVTTFVAVQLLVLPVAIAAQVWLVQDAKDYCEQLGETLYHDTGNFPPPSDDPYGEERYGIQLTEEIRENRSEYHYHLEISDDAPILLQPDTYMRAGMITRTGEKTLSCNIPDPLGPRVSFVGSFSNGTWYWERLMS